jgi:uncharacterized protein YecT (DUF1311 family)
MNCPDLIDFKTGLPDGGMDMRLRVFFIILLGLTFTGFATKRKPCWATAKSQSEMNGCAGEDLKDAEGKMNEVFLQIKNRYQNDPQFLESLEAAQLAWVVFRDAELKAMFPNPDPYHEYGSVYPMCFALRRAELTEERTKQLDQWLVGVEEGEACGGSIPIRQGDGEKKSAHRAKEHE